MNLVLVTPYYFPSVRGTSVTVQRIESGLREGETGGHLALFGSLTGKEA
jgi:hypothetical protein